MNPMNTEQIAISPARDQLLAQDLVGLAQDLAGGQEWRPDDKAIGPDEYIGTALINGHAYSNRHMIRVARVTVDGSTCTVPLSGLADVVSGGGRYEVEVDSMLQAEFDRLGEFQGW